MNRSAYDAIVVGGGPNGLAAALTLAQTGKSVCIIEASPKLGGGSRSEELTLPGFVHDVCSAVHPMAAFSPYFRSLGLENEGLAWVKPPIELAHPLDDGTAAALHRSTAETAAHLGVDGEAYIRLMQPLADTWQALAEDILAQPIKLPQNPIGLLRFGMHARRSAAGLANSLFKQEHARALFAGIAAHANLPLESPFSASIGLALALAGHAVGWPIARGGSQSIANALERRLRALGGEIELEHAVRSIDELPSTRTVLFDLAPSDVSRIAASHLPSGYRRRMARFRRGPGVFKLDLALDAPIPWTADVCKQAGTVHIGGGLDEIATSERAVAEGREPAAPFVILAQPSLFDDTRAPAGKHTVWAYCHVPNGSTADMTERIEAQIERFAPSFRDRIIGRHTMNTRDIEAYNPNNLGGDIAGGALDGLQLLLRPGLSLNPYKTPAPGIYICSASTPPGPGVHGMCGHLAAKEALRFLR